MSKRYILQKKKRSFYKAVNLLTPEKVSALFFSSVIFLKHHSFIKADFFAKIIARYENRKAIFKRALPRALILLKEVIVCQIMLV